MTRHPLHVMIAGAGVGGLCLAQGLRQNGVSVAVYERDRTPDARLQGYRLNIEPVGSRALHECLRPDVWEALVATSGDPGPAMGVFDQRLRELMREDPRPDDLDPADSTHAVSRIELRRLLLTGLEDAVHFDRELTGYELCPNGRVAARFADGSSAEGDVLVGADGIRSAVRRQLLPHARSVDVPAIGVGGKLKLDDETRAWLPQSLQTGKNMIMPPLDFLFTAAFRHRAASAGDDEYVMWAFVAHRDAFSAGPALLALPNRKLAPLRGRPLRDHVEGRMEGWHADLRRLVAESDPETVDQFDFAAAAPVAPWPSGSVTLLGDAIHYMPPVGGMGGNAALRDASRLCRALTSVDRGQSTLPAALQAYEADMLKHGFAAVRGVRLYTRMAISRFRPLRSVARTFFRLCGVVGPLRRAVFADD